LQLSSAPQSGASVSAEGAGPKTLEKPSTSAADEDAEEAEPAADEEVAVNCTL
jgi:hypothetical protein